MLQQSHLNLQGGSMQQGRSTRYPTQDGALWRSRQGRHCLCPPGAAPLWAWLLLGVLVVPGARSFLSEEQEELLVELHNHYRGQVSPSASAMMPLKWDPALKVIAEGYATKCIWNHNPELEDIGENLFAGTGPLNLGEALEKWFLEHLDYNFQNNSCDEDKMCGHYTQMVWADTHRVGCAFHPCNTMEGLDWERASFLVCNYFPAGNYEGERPYVEGDSCSRCPENLHKCANNLCVADVEEEEGEDEEGATATSELSLMAEKEDSTDVQPAATTAPITTTRTTSTMSKPTEPDPEDHETAATHALSTYSSEVKRATEDVPSMTDMPSMTDVPWTTGLEEEEVVEKMEEKSKKEENKQDIAQIKFHNKGVISCGSVISPSLVWAGLTGLLTLRL